MKRRDFLKTCGLGAAAMAAPSVPTFAEVRNINATDATIIRKDPNSKVNIGFIGLGQQAINLLRGFLALPDVKVIAGCDIYDIKRDRFQKTVVDYYTEKGEKKVKCDMYVDFPDLLARKDIDAVVIATPDHQHARIAIAACKAGKDIYLEKPLTLTIFEGQQLVKAVRKYNVILQTGSMQRSSKEWDHLAMLCREGELGAIEKLQVYVGRNGYNGETGAPVPYNVELADKNSRIKDPNLLHNCPAGLDWDKWLGPLPTSVKYHHDFNPTLNEQGRDTCWGTWRWFTVSGGGLMTDWGAHMFDIAQWCIGKDGSAPTQIIPPGYRQYKCLTYKYDNGILMTEEDIDGKSAGLKVYAENAIITVHRGSYLSDNPKFAFELPKRGPGQYETNGPHYRDFIDAVRAHVDPLVPVETGHSSNTTCALGNIAMELNRPITWNPIVEKIMGDAEAQSKLHYQYRSGYEHDLDV